MSEGATEAEESMPCLRHEGRPEFLERRGNGRWC